MNLHIEHNVHFANIPVKICFSSPLGALIRLIDPTRVRRRNTNDDKSSRDWFELNQGHSVLPNPGHSVFISATVPSIVQCFSPGS